MQLLTVFSSALAVFTIGVEASPIRPNQQDVAKHPLQILEDAKNNEALHNLHAGFDSISPPPTVLPPRSDDDDFSMSGKVERAFDVVSPPPKVLPPRSDYGELSMSGVPLPLKARSLNESNAPFIHSRRDGFTTVSPPPKTAAEDPAIDARDERFDSISPPPKVISARHFDVISPPAKTRPSGSKLQRRVNIWTNGFIGNLVNKWTGKSPTPASTLTSYQQNGPSKYGTSEMNTLPKYYGGGSQTPWGGVTTTNANPYKSCPLTGATRSYDFTVAECDIRPDGVETKKAVCVNGQFPGPLIEANYGDIIRVKVTNKLRDEGTSMHWHGFLQTGANQMDGVPGVTQCPIAPGDTMTYEFRAELYGSAW